MKIRVDQPSFAGAQISALLFGRTDYDRYQVGAARVYNLVALPEGPVTRRPGFPLVDFVKDQQRPAQIIDFAASLTDTYMLVLNAGVMRVYKGLALVLSGGAPYEVAHPWTDDQLDGLFWHQDQNLIYVAAGGKPRVIRRISDTNWTITDYTYDAGPVQPLNPDRNLTITASATTGAITLAASGSLFVPGHVGSVWRIDEADFRDPPPFVAGEVVVAASPLRRNRGRIYEAVGYIDASGVFQTGFPGGALWQGPTAPIHDDGDASSGQPGSVQGFFNAVWRYICDAAGYVRITGYTSPTQVSATVTRRLAPSLAAKPTSRWYAAAWSDARGWPNAVGIVDQTLAWTFGPEIYLTQQADTNSFLDIDAEDPAVSYRIKATDGRLVEIQWAYGAGVLIIGAAAGEWVLRGAQTYDRLTPTNVRNVPQDSKGSARQRPCFMNGGIVFIGFDRRMLGIARFNPETEQVEIRELTVNNRRLLATRARQVVYQRNPHGLLWVLLEDGTLAALTVKDEVDVLNAHIHAIPGWTVERLSAVEAEDGTRTELVAIARRVKGGTTQRAILRLAPYFEATAANTATGSNYLDISLAQTFPAPVVTISGLDHFEGEYVCVLADGSRQPDAQVSGGQIVLRQPARTVVIGQKIPWELALLPIEISGNQGSSKGQVKQALSVTTRVLESAGGRVQSGNAPSEQLVPVGVARPGTPIALTTGIMRTSIPRHSGNECTVIYSGDDPLPMTILSVTTEIEITNG